MNEDNKHDVSASLLGMLVVLSAPSGAGKTTLSRMLVDEIENAVYSVSVTSRQPRPDEIEGRDYFFVARERFELMISEGMLLEWALVHDNFYGTAREFIEDKLVNGRIVILDIDVQGALQIKKRFPDAVLIFITPPSLDELRRRLEIRNQDSIDEINKRLKNAAEEMEYIDEYDYKVMNSDLDDALSRIKEIIIKKIRT